MKKFKEKCGKNIRNFYINKIYINTILTDIL